LAQAVDAMHQLSVLLADFHFEAAHLFIHLLGKHIELFAGARPCESDRGPIWVVRKRPRRLWRHIQMSQDRRIQQQARSTEIFEPWLMTMIALHLKLLHSEAM
jgi:hypothetical protein